jgi:hypothetical protein
MKKEKLDCENKYIDEDSFECPYADRTSFEYLEQDFYGLKNKVGKLSIALAGIIIFLAIKLGNWWLYLLLLLLL